nr:MAG TPA: hypothetical protein [Bacteriophage sp.]
MGIKSEILYNLFVEIIPLTLIYLPTLSEKESLIGM